MRILLVVLIIGLPCCLHLVDAFSASASISRRLISSSSSTLGSVSSLSAHVSSSHSKQQRRRDFVIQSLTSAILALPFTAVAEVVIIDPVTQMPKITQIVYLDVEFAKSSSSSSSSSRSSRLVIGLFGDDMPNTVQNFISLCTNNNQPNYVGTTFYRALSGNSIQAGAIGNPSGKAGMTSFSGGLPFPPDNYNIRHTRAGLVSAVRSNTNGDIDSRFFIQTEDDAGWADDRYAAFGIVLDDDSNNDDNADGLKNKGMDLVRRISRVEVKTPQNSPKEAITIVRCGVL
jgi:cyclophilin family peptidyl-prolyl cis-trans isomerase